MKEKEITIYSSGSVYEQSGLKILKSMVKNIVNGRELIWQLFLRDFKSRYKQSLLGWAWIFLMPIITMGTFLLLNISGIIRIGEIPVPYPIFGLLGFSIWQLFSNGWIMLTGSITSSSVIIGQIKFPREVLPLSLMGQIITDFIIRIALVLLTYLIYGLSPSLGTLLLPFYLLPLIMLTLGLGFLTAVLNVIFRDITSFINVGLSFFLFLMPIMYTMPEKGFLAHLNRFNPIFFLINAPRDIMISGKINYYPQFLISSLITLIIFLIAWLIFYISQNKLAERL